MLLIHRIFIGFTWVNFIIPLISMLEENFGLHIPQRLEYFNPPGKFVDFGLLK